MTKKDLAFIKRIIGRPESTSVVKTVSCYVDINRDVPSIMLVILSATDLSSTRFWEFL